MQNFNHDESPQNQWSKLSEICKDSAKETLVLKDKKCIKFDDDELKKLSEQQLNLRDKIVRCRNKNHKKPLKKDRNKIIVNIKN